jgi:uncharacterized membrane protein YgaE (UPF0421/DUF939 family)
VGDERSKHQHLGAKAGRVEGKTAATKTAKIRPFGALVKSQNQPTDWVTDTAVVWKTTLGSVLAWELARWSGSTHPYLAPLTLILCLHTTIGQSLEFAWQRSVGTVMGVLIIGLFAHELPMTAWMLGLVLFCSTAVMKALGLNDKVIHQIALSVLFVWYFEQHSPGYGWDRAKDTVIGAVVAVVFALLVAPPNQSKQAAKNMQKFLDDIATSVTDVGKWIRHGYLPTGAWNAATELQSLRQQLQQTSALMNQTAQTSRLNLYVNKQENRRLQAQFDHVRNVYLHFVELVQTLSEWVSSGRLTRSEAEAWGQSLTELGRWIRDINVHFNARTSATGRTVSPRLPVWSGEVTSGTRFGFLAYHEAQRMIGELESGERIVNMDDKPQTPT